jgi:hypothetical protein
MQPSSHDFSLLCKVNFPRDINLLFGFCERVTDELVFLGSQGGPLALIARISKSTNC